MSSKNKQYHTPEELKYKMQIAEQQYADSLKGDSNLISKSFDSMNTARNKYYSSIENGAPNELKLKIEQAETKYKSSFNSNKCKDILDAFYELQRLKRSYYCSIGAFKHIENTDNIMNELASIDSNDQIENFGLQN